MDHNIEAGRRQTNDTVLIDGASSTWVRLNVGGLFFQTTLGTLRRHDCMLRAMFSGRMPVRKDADGFVLIDRNGKHFDKILDFLREDTVPLPDCKHDVADLLKEARYYLIQGLVDQCVNWLHVLTQNRNEPSGVPLVPTVISDDGVERIARSCQDRPIIELLMNRQNNKYSYTQHSDENFLKNQEIFDKLVIRINNRVIFVKNMGTGSSEMCRWRFHSTNGKKSTEICCTSIVYATDRKQTKVDFPEARIYEEAMNILLSNDSIAQKAFSMASRCGKCASSSVTSTNETDETKSHELLHCSLSGSTLDGSPSVGQVMMPTASGHCACCGNSTPGTSTNGTAACVSAAYTRPTTVSAAYSMLFAPIDAASSGVPLGASFHALAVPTSDSRSVLTRTIAPSNSGTE